MPGTPQSSSRLTSTTSNPSILGDEMEKVEQGVFEREVRRSGRGGSRNSGLSGDASSPAPRTPPIVWDEQVLMGHLNTRFQSPVIPRAIPRACRVGKCNGELSLAATLEIRNDVVPEMRAFNEEAEIGNRTSKGTPKGWPIFW